MHQKESEDDNFDVASETAEKLSILRPVLKPTLFDRMMSIFRPYCVEIFSHCVDAFYPEKRALVEIAQDQNIVVDSDDEDIPEWITKMDNVNPIDGANHEPILDESNPQAPIQSDEADDNAKINGIEIVGAGPSTTEEPTAGKELVQQEEPTKEEKTKKRRLRRNESGYNKDLKRWVSRVELRNENLEKARQIFDMVIDNSKKNEEYTLSGIILELQKFENGWITRICAKTNALSYDYEFK